MRVQYRIRRHRWMRFPAVCRCLVGWRRGRAIRLPVLVMLVRCLVLVVLVLVVRRRFVGRILLGFLRLVVVVRRLW